MVAHQAIQPSKGGDLGWNGSAQDLLDWKGSEAAWQLALGQELVWGVPHLLVWQAEEAKVEAELGVTGLLLQEKAAAAELAGVQVWQPEEAKVEAELGVAGLLLQEKAAAAELAEVQV